MKKLVFVCVIFMLFTGTIHAQPERIGVGLTFATKKRFNNGGTGNPGINIKTWIPIDKRKTFHVVPSVTAFNTLEAPNTGFSTVTYMFHGDLDLQYRLFHEKTLKVVAIAGVNYTQLVSRNEIYITMVSPPVDSTISGFGPVLGGALEMRMSSHWDFIVTGKYSFAGLRKGDRSLGEWYLAAPLSGPIIQVHAVYYFLSRGRGYSRR
jgi:hypothetical protein